jgi:hypothetical protein
MTPYVLARRLECACACLSDNRAKTLNLVIRSRGRGRGGSKNLANASQVGNDHVWHALVMDSPEETTLKVARDHLRDYIRAQWDNKSLAISDYDRQDLRRGNSLGNLETEENKFLALPREEVEKKIDEALRMERCEPSCR